jgi:undecaprenyl phosphate N,N'-diacetylbacillosamine 1-phosphate transferase
LVFFKLGKPVFFTQKRPGKNNKPFSIIKFRTLTNERDINNNLLSEDKRLTKFGAALRSLSLDELPELINVLKGEMSFVGPRPLRMYYLPLYNEYQMRRHEVRPGITGWAQVNGRNSLTWEQKFDLDVWYVDNHSFWLDIKILWLTFLKVIKRENITASDGNFTLPFQGTGEKKVTEEEILIMKHNENKLNN